jgi:hypothetical protein
LAKRKLWKVPPLASMMAAAAAASSAVPKRSASGPRNRPIWRCAPASASKVKARISSSLATLARMASVGMALGDRHRLLAQPKRLAGQLAIIECRDFAAAAKAASPLARSPNASNARPVQ